MTTEIENFRMKIRNSSKLKRTTLSFSLAEARSLEEEIHDLEAHIEQLQKELLQNKTVSIDIVGHDF